MVADTHWFEPLAEFLGPAYLRNAFTKGTEQEVAFLWDALGLEAGDRVLDVGCGPGRHALALARRGAEVTGVDISATFVDLAREAAAAEGLACTFEVADAAEALPPPESAAPGAAPESARGFDAVISLCQGGFGLPRDEADDLAVFEAVVRAAKPGGAVAVSAFSAYFQVRFLEDHDTFDAARGVNHEVASLRGAEGAERRFDLWTSCWTPRELRLLAASTGLTGVRVHGVAPGRYAADPPDLERPELLLLARRG